MNAGFLSQLVVAPLLSFLIAYLMVSWLVKANILKILDIPNIRSLHSIPVPRTGGVGLILSVVVVWLLFSSSLPLTLWMGLGLIALISFADDIKSLPVGLRLLVHILVAMSFSFILLLDSHHWSVALGIGAAIVWMSNLYNFMDGSDGIAGGMALIGFGYYGLAALLAGDSEFAMINFCIMASACAFLRFNFYPARLFMGDVGAVPLGFLAAALGVLGWTKGLWSLWLPLLIFSPFIVDATVTLIKRLIQGKKIWQAHCEHYYQRMVRGRFGHLYTALLAYAFMLLVGGSAVWANSYNILDERQLTLLWGGVYLIIMLAFDWYQQDSFDKRQNVRK